MKKLVITLILLGVFWGAWILIPKTVSTVDTVLVSKQRVAKAVTNTRSGSIQACRRAKLSVPLGGQIATVLVSEGQRVEKGQLLLSLFNEDIHAQLRQAHAQLQSAQLSQQRACVIADTDNREANRHQTLFTQGLISDEQLDVSQSRATASGLACEVSKADTVQVRSQVQIYQAQLSKTQLMAPFTGTIAEINGEVGEFATPSPPGIPTLPMVDLIDDSCFYVSAPIDEVDAGVIQIGQSVSISIDAYREKHFKGRIRRIAPYVFAMEKQARTVEVEVEILSNGVPLLVGYSADVIIEIEANDQVLAIPTQTIFEDNKVWIVKDGRLEKHTLSLGLTNWQLTEVTAGLSEGDQVVIAAHGIELSPGMEVEPSLVTP